MSRIARGMQVLPVALRRQHRLPLLRALGAVVLASALTVPLPAAACAFHFYAPERTVIDWLLESDHIVAMRPDPGDPFHYRVVETLWGEARPVVLSRIVDSRARRRFVRDPDGTAIFAFDGTENSWRSLGFADAAYRPIVDRVLARRQDWDEGYPEERFAIAEALHDHPDPWLRRLGLAELDRAPYALLRTLDLRLGADILLTDRWSLTAFDEVPIRVLLRGVSGEERARREIVGRIETWQSRGDTQRLGLFATALVEIDGPAGVDRLARLYLADPNQPFAKIEAVVEALAIHSTSGVEAARQRIPVVLTEAVEARPDIAVAVARQFASRGNWTMADALERLLVNRRLAPLSALLAVSQYVAVARQGGTLKTIGGPPLDRGGG